MGSPAAEAPSVLTEEARAAYFKAREREEKRIGRVILKKLREEEQSPGKQPRRILVEVAVETGFPLQMIQRIFWTLETRGQIRWDQGRFVPVVDTGQ